MAVLRSETRFNLEIVVVDDGENGDLAQILADLPVSVLRTEGSGSAAVARNLGAVGYEGRALVFIDADVMVQPTCIELLLQPLCNGLAEATVGNYSRNVAGLPLAAKYKQLYLSHVYRRKPGYVASEFWTAIGAIDCHVFRELHGFHPGFRGAGGEDTDLGLRLSRAGRRILSVPDAQGDHRHLLTTLQLLGNDWRKGLLTIRKHAGAQGALPENRHATWRDVFAAALASLALSLAPILAFSGIPLLSFAMIIGATLLGYLASRVGLIKALAGQTASFTLLALVLMFLLDLTRAACVLSGTVLRQFDRMSAGDGTLFSFERPAAEAPNDKR